MGKIYEREKEKYVTNYPVYTARDFFRIKEELNKFAIDKEFIIKGEKKMIHFVSASGLQKWYIEKGALSDKEEWTVKNIPLFRELQDKIDQYNNWERRRDYAIKNSDEGGYQGLVEGMDLNLSIDDIPYEE
jgi:hypothetical protein